MPPGLSSEERATREGAAAQPAEQSRSRKIQRGFERLLAWSRLLVLIPVVFLLVDAAGSFIYGTDILLRTASGVISEPARIGGRLGIFLVVMDTFLVGATLMIAAFGFYELFVIRSERAGQRNWLPNWLQMRDLEDLKLRVVSMLILVAAITFVDRLVESHDEQEVLFLGLGISIIIVALTAFLWLGKRTLPTPGHDPVPASGPPPGSEAAGAPADGASADGGRAAESGPRAGVRAGDAQSAPRAPGGRTRERVTAILGSVRREGSWSAAQRTDVIAAAGKAHLDLREAVLPGQQVRIRTVTCLGVVSVIVPPWMAVADSGTTIFGLRSASGTAAPGRPSAPAVQLSGMCVLGVVRIRRMP